MLVQKKFRLLNLKFSDDLKMHFGLENFANLSGETQKNSKFNFNRATDNQQKG